MHELKMILTKYSIRKNSFLNLSLYIHTIYIKKLVE